MVFENFWHKKEKPFAGFTGFGGGASGLSNAGVSYGPASYEPITVYAWGGGALGVPGDTPLQPRGGFAEITIDGTSFPSEYTRLEVWSGGGGSPSGSGSSPNAVFGGGGGGCCPGGPGPDEGSSAGGGTFVFLGNPTMDAVFNPGGTALNIPVADADARCILAAGGMGGKQRSSGGVAGGPGGGLVAEGNGGTLSGTAPQVSRAGGGDAYIGQNGAPGSPHGSGGGGGGYEGGHTNAGESGWGGCGYVGHISPTGAGSRANPYSGTSPVNEVVYTHGVTLGGRDESSTGPNANPTGYNPGSLYANPAKSSQFFPGADTSGNLNGNIGCPLPNGGAGGYAVVSQLSGNATCPGGNLTTYNLTEAPAATGSAKASGGTIFECGSYTVHRFDSSPTSQTFTTPGSFSETCEYVVIAGGGGGGNDAAGGGGAGGYLTGPTPIGNSASVSITVGTGGEGGNSPTDNQGGNGNPSSAACPAGTITATGGGGGGKGGYASQTEGSPGGSGGGGGQRNSKAGGEGTAGQGNDGGTSGPGSGARSGGGGGGAGGAGITGSTNPNDSPTNTVGANGGAGVQLPATFRDPTAPAVRILGCPGPSSSKHYVAGGGAGSGDHKGGRGGIGASPTEVNNWTESNVNNTGYAGGGDAGSQGGLSYAYPGVNGTGGGGGGANFVTPGGDGGNGIVLIAYPT